MSSRVTPGLASLRLAMAGHAFLAVLTLSFALAGDFGAAVTSGVLFVASFAYWLREEQLPNAFDLLIVVVALVNAVGWTFGLHVHAQPHFGLLSHALATAFVTLALAPVAYRGDLRRVLASRPAAYAAAVATLALGLGVLWELWEYGAAVLLDGRVAYGLGDVVRDLFATLLGALLAAWLGVWQAGTSSGGVGDRPTRG